ncbi:MAG TPA: hypothetical protein VMF59_05680 [Bacteroidota bacterium]|nr:hypothetical protein [Bacteroidota bacterium]
MTEMISASFDRDPDLRERLVVFMHLRVCLNCRRFSRQLAFISRAMREARREALLMAASRIPPLSYSAREKIKSAISAYLA